MDWARLLLTRLSVLSLDVLTAVCYNTLIAHLPSRRTWVESSDSLFYCNFYSLFWYVFSHLPLPRPSSFLPACEKPLSTPAQAIGHMSAYLSLSSKGRSSLLLYSCLSCCTCISSLLSPLGSVTCWSRDETTPLFEQCSLKMSAVSSQH